MKYFIYVIFCILLVCGCKINKRECSPKWVVIDSPYGAAYETKYKFPPLPDSLGGKNCKGIVAIEGRINDSFKLKIVRIMKLQVITQSGDTIVNYAFNSDSLSLKCIYPKKVKVYLPFFETFFKTIKVRKIHGVTDRSQGRIMMIWHLNEKIQ